jgi:hypothetical protein
MAWNVEYTDEFEQWWNSLDEQEQEEIDRKVHPRRSAILLVGGDKTGDAGWYDRYVPVADDLFDKHLQELEESDGEKL